MEKRYGLWLANEFSQAQLNQTQAQIANVSAKHDYESQTAFLDYQLGRLQ